MTAQERSRKAWSALSGGVRRIWRWWALRARPDPPPARVRLVAEWVARLLIGALGVSVLMVLALRWIPPVTTSYILQARVLSGSDLPDGIHRDWVSRRDISSELAIAVVAAEDQRFPEHHGLDLKAIQEALVEDDRQRGASTISQQVAKNLFLWPGGWVRKGIEAYFTILIEALWPKKRILEMYLNVAEFGPGIYGAEAASQRYFGKPAASLNRDESTRLAAVLPSPRRMSAARPSEYVRDRAAEIASEVRRLGGPSYLDGVW